MTMEGEGEVVLRKDLQIIKGKRTKRPRPVSPLTLTMASRTTSSSTGGESGRSNDDSMEFDGASDSTMTSVELEVEDEEKHMAYCLMLLSQGQARKQSEPASSYVHRCTTCNRRFPSFQALGGHRAAHKKPKAHHDEDENMKSRVHE
ncbi:Zinc finger protein ZAT8 [Hibiscus syriacus]|uniref:Zinc finger protein ZAT8 n=1 Tax=Hibiscus syriacus TaxID=106335 RepID=A0A6A3BQW6_HIBSY|nr:Zinc finger protein ZAT8 [Hibiscus syriacus]